MRIKIAAILLCINLTFLFAGCGYYFPYIYEGPSKVIYMPDWKNRTSELDLDSKVYQSISKWFQKSKAISTTKDKQSADLILAGEIISIELPSISWNRDADATEVNVRLRVRYILKDLKSDDILWEVSGETWTKAFESTGDSSELADNEEEALEKIIEDLSERIYLKTLDKIRKLNLKDS